jgi:c-di-GMP-binding flagellar brake protein YcgR
MVDASNEHLILDELKPEKGQSNIDTISLINIEGQVRGITSSFTSRLIHIEHAGGIKSHIMSFPTTINYKQKRIFYRVPVGYSKQYRVTLSMNNYQSYTGELRDLSLGGIRAIFPADAMINEGDIVASCLINFKNQPTISCPLKIRFSHPNNNDKMLIVGGSFLKISLQQERAIQRLVCALEREQLKKRI